MESLLEGKELGPQESNGNNSSRSMISVNSMRRECCREVKPDLRYMYLSVYGWVCKIATEVG